MNYSSHTIIIISGKIIYASKETQISNMQKIYKLRIVRRQIRAMKLHPNQHNFDRMVFVPKLMNWMKLLVNQRSNTLWFDIRHVLQRGIQFYKSKFIHVRPFFKRGNINVSSPHAQSELIWTKSETREKISTIYKRFKCFHDTTLWRENKFPPLQNGSYSVHFLLLDFSSFSSLMSVCVFWCICFRSLVYSNFIYIVSDDNCNFLQWFSIAVLTIEDAFFFLLVPPSVKAVNHVVGAPVESHVLLECIVEVFPRALNGWYRNDGK